MEQAPDAKLHVDLQLRLAGVKLLGQVDLHDGRADLQRAELGTPEEVDQVDHEGWVGDLYLQKPQAPLGSREMRLAKNARRAAWP